MAEKEFYCWKVYLLPKTGWKSLILIPALFLAGLWGLYLGGVILLILALILLIYSLRDFLFPLTYQLTTDGVKLRGLFIEKLLRWEEVDKIERERGVVLFYLRRDFSSYRFTKPIHLYLNGNEEEVWRKIERYWKRSS
jgi:hypothetical protein